MHNPAGARLTDERPPFRFAITAQVAFSDTDAQGIVYYGRYGPYFDTARVEYLRRLDLLIRSDEHGDLMMRLVMRHFEIEFLAPAHFGDLLEVFCRVARIGTTSLRFDFEVITASLDARLATASQTLVFVDDQTRASRSLPDPYRAAIANFEKLK